MRTSPSSSACTRSSKFAASTPWRASARTSATRDSRTSRRRSTEKVVARWKSARRRRKKFRRRRTRPRVKSAVADEEDEEEVHHEHRTNDADPRPHRLLRDDVVLGRRKIADAEFQGDPLGNDFDDSGACE